MTLLVGAGDGDGVSGGGVMLTLECTLAVGQRGVGAVSEVGAADDGTGMVT